MSVHVFAPGGLVDDYRHHPALGAWDELLDADGVRPHQQTLASTVEAMGLAGLLSARAEARGQVLDEGVTHGSQHRGASRPWSIDPLPLVLDPAEWTLLERGLAQRARLFDLILRDLYTDRTLLRRRLLPAAAVLGHPGFARQADQLAPAPGRQLLLTSTDLGRAATGSWQVLADRTQTQVGAGYAMVTRRIVSRVMAGLHRSSDLVRLRGFFHAMTAALADAAPTATEAPRVVVLSPGSAGNAAFDASFLATMLGFPVAEADDLVTRGGRLWLRAGDRLEPVDVVLNRVPAALSDPLEFRGDSQVGVPGLVEASRNRRVTSANPVGAGVLDNPALLGWLAPVAQALLGEQLLLESPQTWWCGDPAALSHVRAHLDSLVIKPTARGHQPVRHGWALDAAARAELLARIEAEPWAWCGQEPVSLSTAPVVTGQGLEPRRFLLRSFGVATGDDYAFLPGGLGRVAGAVTQFAVSSAAGSLAKDVWLPSGALTSVSTPVAGRTRAGLATARPVEVSPRVARTLLIIGRHAERAEATARLLKVTDDLTEDHSSRPGTPGAAAMTALTGALVSITGIDPGAAEAPVDHLRRVALDPLLPGGVAYSAALLTSRAQRVRDLLSLDAWSVFARLENTLATAPPADLQLQLLLDDVIESMLAYAGIMAQSMVRDSSWAFLDAGGRLERAQHTVKLLLATLVGELPSDTGDLVAEAVLRSCESIITHRRRAAAGTGPAEPPASALLLLVTDDANPRSIAHQLAALAADLRLAGDEELAAQAAALHGRLGSLPAHAAVPEEAADASALRTWLEGLARELDAFEARVALRHFVRQATRRSAEPLGTTWTPQP